MDKILVPVDGSPTSEHAAEKAIEVAKKFNSKLTFLVVAKNPEIIGTGAGGIGPVFIPKEHVDELKAEQVELMDYVIEKLDLEGVDYETRILIGEPFEEIIALAENENFDLIIMGRRGFSKIKRFFLGSVSQRVISGSPCPVLIINERKS